MVVPPAPVEPPPPPKPPALVRPVNLTGAALLAARNRNLTTGLAVTKAVAAERGVDWWALWIRVVFCGLTESSWRNLANVPTEKSIAAWGLNAEQVKILERSWLLPNDGFGSNGKSCGVMQQIDRAVNAAADPPIKWGWGADCTVTMDAAQSVRLFAAAVQITDDLVYRGITFAHAAIADVLRTQQPLVTESSSSNYSAARWAHSLRIAENAVWVD